MAVENLITEHIDIWTSAVKTKSASGRGSSKKLELYGVKKLRELILELAVRGKLVPQDPNDEPASMLLERIAAEKAQLIKDKKIKKPKKLLALNDKDIPFRLPEGWEWSRVNELAKVVTDGVHHTPKYLENGVPFISVKDIDGKSISFDDCKYISQEQHEEINQRCNPEKGDILLCRIGTLGRATIVDTEKAFSLFVSVGLLKFFNEQLIPEYLHTVFHSPLLLRQYDEIKAGGSHTNKLNLGDIPRLKIPVAPLHEQHRIVAKVDELMALCDQLEQQTEASIEAHQVLVTTLLDTLTNSADADELMQNWARISEHFDTLFTTEESIDQLKQTILQLAVMGKLVPQDPSDEPAAELLKRVAEEKAQLVKEKKIKKQKALPPISEDEKPFELPSGWEWCRFGSLFKSFSNGLYKPAKFYTDAGVISLRMYNIQDGKIDFEGAKRVEVEPNELEQFLLEKGDLLINRVNSKELVGKTAIIPQLDEPLVYESMNMRAKPFTNYLSAEYLNLFMMTALAQQSISSFAKEAIGQASINQGQVSSMAIPLPTFNEQKRIVLKINELLVICEELKARLKESQTTQLLLTDAIVEQAG
ncbi:type I restriction endonuclease subunit S [Vibrio parahaemolyticus]|uniref:restriction endonuclease subunit S n=1 Tax=Vibrio parahaemolyticus TaxID=670 RepID=UPI00084A5467|nr:restriction endonuclease subunit S [Vibrio parahaemolyticus]ODX31494.1 type I restriction endonuclease subunit S [Vibrio parahaemolyticus]HAS6794172.1 restriction endonuclease subunit S [Vibrio parahaemolyticus]